MADTGMTPRLPAQFDTGVAEADEWNVSELVAENAGSHSPFGDIELPLPVSSLRYVHPGPADRPRLAGDR